MKKLICIPFAGGSSYSFQNMVPYVQPDLDLQTVEIPGRGRRMAEPFISDTMLLVQDVVKSIQSLVEPGESYLLFGHSMGALLGFLAIHELRAQGTTLPQHFFCSGANAPTYPKEDETPTYLLPKAAFIEKLRKLGGSPTEVLEHDGLMELFEPILRSDFQIVERYEHVEKQPLDIPMTVLIGTEDKVKPESAELWKNEAKSVELHILSGGHFFIFDHLETLGNLLKTAARD